MGPCRGHAGTVFFVGYDDCCRQGQRIDAVRYAHDAYRRTTRILFAQVPHLFRRCVPNRQSEPHEPVHFDDEAPSLQVRQAGRPRVALLVVDHEQFAAGAVLPPEAGVGREQRPR